MGWPECVDSHGCPVTSLCDLLCVEATRAVPVLCCRAPCCLSVCVCSALMTQVVSEPAYSDIMRSLMLNTPDDPEGMELYLRNPASFNIPTGEAHGSGRRNTAN